MLYIEKFTFRNCSGFLQIRSHFMYLKYQTYVLRTSQWLWHLRFLHQTFAIYTDDVLAGATFWWFFTSFSISQSIYHFFGGHTSSCTHHVYYDLRMRLHFPINVRYKMYEHDDSATRNAMNALSTIYNTTMENEAKRAPSFPFSKRHHSERWFFKWAICLMKSLRRVKISASRVSRDVARKFYRWDK